MLLSGSLDIIGLDNKSIFSLPYKVGKLNIQHVLGVCACVCACVYVHTHACVCSNTDLLENEIAG